MSSNVTIRNEAETPQLLRMPGPDPFEQATRIARLELASELALTLLEGKGSDLHLDAGRYYGGPVGYRRLAKTKPLTAVQRGRLAAAVLEKGQTKPR